MARVDLDLCVLEIYSLTGLKCPTGGSVLHDCSPLHSLCSLRSNPLRFDCPIFCHRQSHVQSHVSRACITFPSKSVKCHLARMCASSPECVESSSTWRHQTPHTSQPSHVHSETWLDSFQAPRTPSKRFRSTPTPPSARTASSSIWLPTVPSRNSCTRARI